MARAGAAAAAAAEMFVARPRTVARVPTTGHASKSHLRQQHIKERQAFFAPKNKVPFSPFCASDTTRRARWSGKRQGCSEECSRAVRRSVRGPGTWQSSKFTAAAAAASYQWLCPGSATGRLLLDAHQDRGPRYAAKATPTVDTARPTIRRDVSFCCTPLSLQ